MTLLALELVPGVWTGHPGVLRNFLRAHRSNSKMIAQHRASRQLGSPGHLVL